MDTFTRLQMAAMVTAINPTPAQAEAGNYRKGRATVHGLKIAIENARGTERRGTGADGRAWSNLMTNHYGHFEGFLGNDGDGVDVFIGAWPESKQVWIINQNGSGGAFDEHKVMLGFTSEEQARNGYLNSYTKGWNGLGSITACTIEQLRWWLKYGNKSKPVTPESLPYDGTNDMKNIFDNAASLAQVIYAMRRDDPDGQALDAITVQDIMAQSDGENVLDALVIPFAKVERKMGQMQAIMNAAGDALSVSAIQVTPPFKQRGTTNVAGIFELSDGQTVSVFFHNPDVTPNRIAPQDELVSWKWMLNKKDITILVAPEKGDDLNAREVSRRIMRVAEKNSERFAKANADKANRIAAIEGMKSDIAAKESILAALNEEIAQLEAQKAAKPAKPAEQPATGNPGGLTDAEMVVLIVTKSYKSFARLENAMKDTQSDRWKFTNDGITEQEYMAARDSLNAKGIYLKRSGITEKGIELVNSFSPELESGVGGKLRAFAGKFAKKPESKPAVQDPQENDTFSEDRAFLRLAIDGSEDFYDKAVTDKLADIAKRHANNSNMVELIKDAKTAAKNFFMAEFQKKTAA